MELHAGDVYLEIDQEHGARISRLTVGDLQILTPRVEDTMRWGCYAMVPWAGRIRHGKFHFDGQDYQLPLNLPPHAIHGTGFTRPWRHTATGVFEIDLGPDWPFPGRALQTYKLTANSLRMELEVHSDGPEFPASVGWHPWFKRQLAWGETAQLTFQAPSMYYRDEAHIATSQRVAIKQGPWDDCFADVAQPVSILWPGALAVTMRSSAKDWVIFTEPKHAFCVEPQTGPPDALNIQQHRVTPEQPLKAWMELSWTQCNGLP